MIFIIPLRSKATSSDWSNVSKRLQATINSIFCQNNSRGLNKVIVCGHEKPDFLDKNFSQEVTFIEADFAPPKDSSEYMIDKLNKKRLAGTYLKSTIISNSAPVLVMQLDADDILHPDLVSNITLLFEKNNNLNDVKLMSGYAFDMSRQELAYLDGVNKIFYRNCGSSFISKLSITDLGENVNSECYFNELTNHVRYPEIARSRNRVVGSAFFPGVMYLVNHGSNDASERHGVKKMQNFIDDYKVEKLSHPMALSMIDLI